jgi:hypothetical protein
VQGFIVVRSFINLTFPLPQAPKKGRSCGSLYPFFFVAQIEWVGWPTLLKFSVAVERWLIMLYKHSRIS